MASDVPSLPSIDSCPSESHSVVSPILSVSAPLTTTLSAEEVQANVRATLLSTQASLKKIEETQRRVKESLDASKDIELRWLRVKGKFQEVLDKCVRDIGRGLKAGDTLGGRIAPQRGLPKVDEGDDGDDDSDYVKHDKLKRLAILGNDPSLNSICRRIRADSYKNVVVLLGAGASTSAGIPDFRTPGSGLYSQVKSWGLPSPESVFSVEYFRNVDSAPFFKVAQDMYPNPEKFGPTPAHMFIKELHDNGILRRCYTQNIDGLERMTGLPAKKLVEAHGSFHGCGKCATCGHEVAEDKLRVMISNGDAPCEKCDGHYKPPIVFFGENLPTRFGKLCHADMEAADLLIVMGTSLKVAPFSNLPYLVGDGCPRLLFNREAVGPWIGGGDEWRDVAVLGDCDGSVAEMKRLLGWNRTGVQMSTPKEPTEPPAKTVKRLATAVKTARRLSNSNRAYSVKNSRKPSDKGNKIRIGSGSDSKVTVHGK